MTHSRDLPVNLRQPPEGLLPEPEGGPDPTAPPEDIRFAPTSWGWVWWAENGEGPKGISVRTEPITRWTKTRDWVGRHHVGVAAVGFLSAQAALILGLCGAPVPEAMVLVQGQPHDADSLRLWVGTCAVLAGGPLAAAMFGVRGLKRGGAPEPYSPLDVPASDYRFPAVFAAAEALEALRPCGSPVREHLAPESVRAAMQVAVTYPERAEDFLRFLTDIQRQESCP